jgi:hypothetical protein
VPACTPDALHVRLQDLDLDTALPALAAAPDAAAVANLWRARRRASRRAHKADCRAAEVGGGRAAACLTEAHWQSTLGVTSERFADELLAFAAAGAPAAQRKAFTAAMQLRCACVSLGALRCAPCLTYSPVVRCTARGSPPSAPHVSGDSGWPEAQRSRTRPPTRRCRRRAGGCAAGLQRARPWA